MTDEEGEDNLALEEEDQSGRDTVQMSTTAGDESQEEGGRRFKLPGNYVV